LLKIFENWKIIFIIINRNADNYLLFLPSCLLKKEANKNIKGGKEGEEIKNRKKKEKEKRKKEGEKKKEKGKKEGKEKRKGSPVKRVEAVAVAWGSKVCTS
jgi:hypothetical protein